MCAPSSGHSYLMGAMRARIVRDRISPGSCTTGCACFLEQEEGRAVRHAYKSLSSSWRPHHQLTSHSIFRAFQQLIHLIQPRQFTVVAMRSSTIALFALALGASAVPLGLSFINPLVNDISGLTPEQLKVSSHTSGIICGH